MQEFEVCVADADVLVVLEIFGGSCAVTRAALRDAHWRPLAPADLLFGDDFFEKSRCDGMIDILDAEDPDLVVL